MLRKCVRPHCPDKENAYIYTLENGQTHLFTIANIVLGLEEAPKYDSEENEEGFMMIRTPKPEENPVKFIIVKITKRHHYISTPYQRPTLYDRSNCHKNTQHYHTIFDLETIPKRSRLVRLTIYTNIICQFALALYIYQGGNDKIYIDIRISKEAIIAIYKRENADINNLLKNELEESY